MSSQSSDDPDRTVPGPQRGRGAPQPSQLSSTPPSSTPPSTPRTSSVGDDATIARPGVPARKPETHADELAGDPTMVKPAQATRMHSGDTAAGATLASGDAGRGLAGARREPQVFGGRFEVVEVLGEGGMGKVYSVRDRQIEGRAVALKVLLPRFSRNEKFRSLFFQEIRAAQNFVNEHVTQVRDCGQMDDGRLFVTMDLVQGESLRDMLAREGSLRPRHALEIARQTLLALASGHERGFVHRDVKPSNVMLATRISKTDENPYGVGVRVLDFGIAGLAAELEEGNVAGTPLYMSPEQIQGQRLDARSDLFAVGVVLYEMLAGRRPFEGKTLQQITTSVIETDVAPRIAEMTELSAPIRKILERALQKDRDKRFQSATEFIEAIESSSAYKLPSAVPGWVVGALAVTVVAASVEGYFLWSQASRVEAMADARDSLQRRVDEAQDTLTSRLAEQENAHKQAMAVKDGDLAAAKASLATANETIRTQGDEIQTLKANKGDDYTSIKAELDLQRSKLDSLQTRVDDAERARAEISEEKRLALEKVNRLEADISALELRAQKAEDERDALTAQLNPSVRKANAFDDVLSILERRGGAQARSLYDQAVNERVFERPSRPGTDLVEELIETELALERFDVSRAQGGALDIPALLDASRRLTQARNLRQNFQVAANDWLKAETPEQDPNQRIDRLDEYIAALAARVDPEVGALSGYHEEDWTRVAEGGPAQGPKAAIAHHKVFACQHFQEFARAALALCESQIAPGGKLDTRALSAASYLDEWGAHLESERAARDEASAGLLAFAYARRWYDNDENNDGGFDWSRVATPAVDGKQSDWRAVMRLQYELAQPDAGFPIKSGRRLVYHMQNDSPLRWRVVELARGADFVQGGPWELSQSNFKADALPIGAPETLRIVRRRGVFLFDGASDPLLDLKATGDNVWVAPFPELSPPPPPPQMGVSQVVMQEHRDAIATGAGPCLVWKRGSVLRWFSPEFGMVLEELEGQPVRTELVFATPVR